ASVEFGVRALASDVRADPEALETVWISVIAFSGNPELLCPLTPIDEFVPPALQALGDTALGAALRMLEGRISIEVVRGGPDRRGDYRPLVVLMTDGAPNRDDGWPQAAALLERHKVQLVACAAGAE